MPGADEDADAEGGGEEVGDGGIPFGGMVSFRISGGARAAGRFLLADAYRGLVVLEAGSTFSAGRFTE